MVESEQTTISEPMLLTMDLNFGVDYSFPPSDSLYLDEPPTAYDSTYQNFNMFSRVLGDSCRMAYNENNETYDVPQKMSFHHTASMSGHIGQGSGSIIFAENPYTHLSDFLNIANLFDYRENAYTSWNYTRPTGTTAETIRKGSTVRGKLTLVWC